MLQAGRLRDRIPDEVDFFNLPKPSSRTMALGSTQPLTEMSTRNIPGGKGWPAHKADNLTTICEPTVYKMWEPQHLTALWVSTAHYRDTFTLPTLPPLTSVCCFPLLLLTAENYTKRISDFECLKYSVTFSIQIMQQASYKYNS
jgi:hypothetical protein